jgi:hypothetical protein
MGIAHNLTGSFSELFIKNANANILLQEYHSFDFIYTFMQGRGGLTIGIFSPSGEPISPHRLRCSPFAVFKYSFMGHCLGAAAILARG